LYYAKLRSKSTAMMPPIPSPANLVLDTTKNHYVCTGQWTTLYLNSLTLSLQEIAPPEPASTIHISGKQLAHFDSAGALLLIQYKQLLTQKNASVNFTDFTKEQYELIELIESKQALLEHPPSEPLKDHFVEFIGKQTINKLNQIDGFVVLIGDLTDKMFLAATHWRRFQFSSILSNISSTGIQALPILALLSFLIGVVLAYQMGLQLETYGANIFIAYISGMAIFREFAPLITAIIVAGRTSSAFTAQIGSMKINEEVDALTTMGLSATEFLVAPKVIALLIVFPLIIFWSDVFSILGAMLMAKFRLGVGYIEFLTRLQDSVGLKQLLLGLYKAPAFALLIALVGCFQGFRVESKSDSVGKQTTKSVVQALFLIIITDAIYSIIYSWLDL
jgi:phospholipid/cholesterol/gamma-HCH transport system permease protein